ncbi:MAG: choice-of-anchor D domain-containing protein, partial [Gaiellaceae bacterium]
SLLVADNAAGSPQSIPLTGTGIPVPAPVAAVSPATVAFPDTVTNVLSAALPVTVSNTGNAPLSVSGVTLGGANAGDFAVSSNTCLAGPVAAGGSCTVNVTFTPSALGARSGSLLVADNAAGSPQSVALSGNGVAPPPSATFVFGSQTIQAKAVAPAAGTATAFKTSTASAGTVSNVRVFVDTGSTATGLQVALYGNTSTNHPGTRLATGTLASPVVNQFNLVLVTPTANVTADQTLWIAILGTGGTLRFRDTGAVAAGSSEVSLSKTLTAMPATWASGAASSDSNLSAWAAGTVSPTPIVRVGNATTEAKAQGNNAGTATASKYVAASTGSVTRLRVFLDPGSAAGTVAVGLYSNAAGHPGTLLTSGTVTGAVPNTQNVASVASVSVTAGTTYWIAVLAPATAGNGKVTVRLRNAVGAGASEASSSKTLTALPSTWVTGATSTLGLMSAVATS